MKKTTFILSLAVSISIFVFLIWNANALAEGTTDYLLVKDLPFIGSTTDIKSYLSNLFKLGLGIAVTLAIIMVVINGIKYMTSTSPGGTEGAKKGIQDALLGLALIFASVLILSTINPALTRFDFVQTIKEAVGATGEGKTPPPSDDKTLWPDDSVVRNLLRNGGVLINRPNNCTYVGEKSCTSVTGLQAQAVSALLNLKTKCNCSVVITGGTEYWAHQTHGDNRTVDLRASADLNTYLGGKGAVCGDTRAKDGAVYRWEDTSCPWKSTGDHWHVSY